MPQEMGECPHSVMTPTSYAAARDQVLSAYHNIIEHEHDVTVFEQIALINETCNSGLEHWLLANRNYEESQ